MKQLKPNLPKYESVNIYPLYDVHFGERIAENTFGIEFIQRKEGENCKALTDMARTLKQQVALRNLFDNEKGEK